MLLAGRVLEGHRAARHDVGARRAARTGDEAEEVRAIDRRERRGRRWIVAVRDRRRDASGGRQSDHEERDSEPGRGLHVSHYATIGRADCAGSGRRPGAQAETIATLRVRVRRQPGCSPASSDLSHGSMPASPTRARRRVPRHRPRRPGGAVRPARRSPVVDRLLGRLGLVPRQRVQAPGRDRGLDRRAGAHLAAGRAAHRPSTGTCTSTRIVGSPTAPAAAASIPAAAAQLLAAAQTSSGCTTPIIALNEMAGRTRRRRGRPARPPTATNLLALVTALATAGARPFVLVPGTPHPPNVAGAAANWWQHARDGLGHRARGLRVGAEDLLGRARCSARARCASRSATALQTFLGISVPAGAPRDDARLPVGHRLRRPRGAAAHRQLARGRQARGARGEAGRGRARDRVRLVVGLGDVRRVRRRRRQGRRRVHLPVDARPGRCATCSPRSTATSTARSTRARSCSPPACSARSARRTTITTAAIDRLCAARTRAPGGDSARCSSATSSRAARPRSSRSAAQEAAIIYGRFKGSRARYVAALATRGATPDVGRAAIADGLKLQTIERGLHVPAPTAAAVRAWRKAHGGTRVRLVTSSIPLGWLGNRKDGHRAPGQRRAAAGAARAHRPDAARADAAGHRAHHGRQRAPAAPGGGLRREPGRLRRSCARRRATPPARRGSRAPRRRRSTRRSACATSCRPRRRRTIAARAPFLRPLR